jgi:hypothetical protein
MKKRHPDIEKYCLNCGRLIERKRYGSRIEDFHVYKNRKFCGQDCYAQYRSKHKGDDQSMRLTARIEQDIAKAAKQENLTPLEFMLREMNRTTNSLSYRKEMAALACPYVHAKLDSVKATRKEERAAAAAEVAKGNKFAPTAPPKIVPIR